MTPAVVVKEKLQVFLSDKKLVAWSGHFGSRLTCHQRHDFLSSPNPPINWVEVEKADI